MEPPPGFVAGDAIDLLNTTADGAVPAGNAVAVTDGVTPVVSLAALGIATDSNFDITSDGRGGELVTYGNQPAGTPSPPSLPLVTHVPATFSGTTGAATPIPGVSVTDANADPTTTLTVTLTDTDGTLAAGETGASVVTSSNGALTLGITGTLAQVNADLATLTYTGAATGSDTISVNSTDSLGNADAHMIPVIVVPSGPTSVTVPGPGGAPETLEFGSPALPRSRRRCWRRSPRQMRCLSPRQVPRRSPRHRMRRWTLPPEPSVSREMRRQTRRSRPAQARCRSQPAPATAR